MKSYAPVSTKTKTKLNIQQTAMVGIAAVCTAALLGAFTANFAVAVSGVRTAVTGPTTAYFRFSNGASDTYIIKLTDTAKISQARAILTGQVTGATHVMGKIIKAPAEFNPVWHTYLDPASVTFFENAMEVCDATIQYVEDHYDEIGGAFLPGNVWCPWGSRLVEEVTYPSIHNLAYGKPARIFLRDYAGTSKWTATDEKNYKTYAEARGYTASKLTDGRWINLNSLAYGANWKFGFEIDLQQPTTVGQVKLYWGHYGESPAIHEATGRNGQYFMQDYHVYAWVNNQWVQIAGKDAAPAERVTTIDLAAATTSSKLRVTSGVDANGNATRRARNWIGVYEVEVYGKSLEEKFVVGLHPVEDKLNQMFIVSIIDPVTIQQAQDCYGYGQAYPGDPRCGRHITGRIAAGDGGFNTNWNWHLIPETVRMVETSMELCDGVPNDVERDGINFDAGTFCPWASYIAALGDVYPK